jgi:16S rRNA (cytidine1402-2'-O)-methyltransferase
LLARFEIQVALTSCHQHTSPSKIETLVQRLEDGEDMALLTDAGTPGVCDPGPALVTAAANRGIEILPIPGPCALTAALSISGFDAQRFSFLGFLPRKDGKRRKVLLEALEREETFCLYESPFRVIATLKSIAEVAPENQVIVCRELTKKFEETLRGKATEVLETLQAKAAIKGEFVIVVSNPFVKKRASED